jgi:hypothetical protein
MPSAMLRGYSGEGRKIRVVSLPLASDGMSIRVMSLALASDSMGIRVMSLPFPSDTMTPIVIASDSEAISSSPKYFC